MGDERAQHPTNGWNTPEARKARLEERRAAHQAKQAKDKRMTRLGFGCGIIILVWVAIVILLVLYLFTRWLVGLV